MKVVNIVPNGWPCTLAECPPGLFEFDGSFGFKTEYGRGDNLRWPEVFCDSGEAFWGGVSGNENVAALIVQPCVIEVDERAE